MLVVERSSGTLRDLQFRDLPNFIRPGDCVVLNRSRVIPSRLFGRSDAGAVIQLFLLKPAGELRWIALGRPGRRLLPRRVITFERGVTAHVLETHERGERLVEFQGVANNEELLAFLEEFGHIPLPPYIHRDDNALDRARYQTVFAQERGSVAAPTAGLHFTPEIFSQLDASIAHVTLHVGLGTFQPIDREDFENHTLHHESYQIDPEDWRNIEQAKRVVAVGTTSVRTVESASKSGQLSGETDLFLYPGAAFKKTGALLTNFHLPKSSLLLLVCAFGGTELILKAYRHAVEQRYRFFSYGDCMLVI
jgi:S-adenosylmethionine:tRNA ribosyltransferase-isomerase